MALDTIQSLYGGTPTSYGKAVPGSDYSYSFSGTDCRMSAYFPQAPQYITLLPSLHTLSISIHEGKSQVRSLGYKSIKGMTRGVRTIAGSLILIVVNDHPMRTLMDQLNHIDPGSDTVFGWSVDNDVAGTGTYQDTFLFQNRLSTLLPPFNILGELVSEISPIVLDTSGTNTSSSKRYLLNGAGFLLEGIEIIDEGYVLSVNDIVTEITCSFIAKNYKPLSSNIFSASNGNGTVLAPSLTEVDQRAADLYNRCYPKKPTIITSTLTSDLG